MLYILVCIRYPHDVQLDHVLQFLTVK